ncbi:MAG: type II toxin-antitoxin system RelE/ParE family toxin [Pseudomonadota bacterium]
MKILLTHTFKRTTKKLHRNQISELEKAIQEIQNNPAVGDTKVGDLAGVRVYKFHKQHQLILLAYTHNERNNELFLLSFTPHENFYKNMKKSKLIKYHL